MSEATPAVWGLARQLIGQEAAREPTSHGEAGAALRAVDRLRLSLSRLIGVEGFRTLLSRALTLAKAEAPELAPLQVCADGSIEGLGELRSPPDGASSAESVLLAELLGLLVLFIGEALALQLLRDIGPGVAPGDSGAGSAGEEMPR
jgi:hypothetical protein